MAQIIGDFFQTPPSLSRSMRKIMAQIVKGQIGNVFPLVFGRVRFQVTKPVVDPLFGQPCASL